MALNQAFNADTLSHLRKAVLRAAAEVGMTATRAADVVLTVHELAANAVRYGGGAGVVQLSTGTGELHCEVTDGGTADFDGQGSRGDDEPWPLTPGHGLWLVNKIADQVSVIRSRGRSRVTAIFVLPLPALLGVFGG
jgi:anti-sigma regulatory factor (Ser/Thr protein kinase)